MPSTLRDLGATLLAVLLAVFPAWAGWEACPDMRPAGGSRLACCPALASTASAACCCVQTEAPPADAQQSLSAPSCGCRAVPARPGRPARSDGMVAQGAAHEVRNVFSALVSALVCAPCAAPRVPCGDSEPPGLDAPPAAIARGGTARLYLLAVARL